MTDATWVFHRGALGDCVLLWPMLRALRRAGPVTLVTDGSVGRLAQRRVGIELIDGAQPRFARLWSDGPAPAPVESVARVVWFHAPAVPARRAVWLGNVQAMFPRARVQIVRRRPDRRFALRWTARGSPVAPVVNRAGPVTLHVGAGSAQKRWPLTRWLQLVEGLGADGERPALLAGEVELEQFTGAERAAFEQAGGRFALDAGTLETALASARIVACADSGPGHLAAQLGVLTVSLFGPTDAARWAPVGPQAHVLAPPAPAPMQWLDAQSVAAALASCQR